MSAFTKEEIDALYAPFPLEAHTTREGHMNKAKTKIQWFTYLDRAAVQRRLETLFPGEWSLDIIETHRESDYVTVSLKMTIRGVSRSCNGGQSLKFDKDTIDEDKEKGAWTEAFRRVASVWGLGLYLYEMDFAIWTDGYESGNWDQAKQRQNEAEKKFGDWYARQFKASGNGGSSRPTPPPQSTPTSFPIPQNPQATPNGNGHSEPPSQPKNAKDTPALLLLNDLIDSPDLKQWIDQLQHRRALVNLLAKHDLFANCETTPDMLEIVRLYMTARAKATDHEKSQDEAIAAVKATLKAERTAKQDEMLFPPPTDLAKIGF